MVKMHVGGLYGVYDSLCYSGKSVVNNPFVLGWVDVVAVFVGRFDFGCSLIVSVLEIRAWVIQIIWVRFHLAMGCCHHRVVCSNRVKFVIFALILSDFLRIANP